MTCVPGPAADGLKVFPVTPGPLNTPPEREALRVTEASPWQNGPTALTETAGVVQLAFKANGPEAEPKPFTKT